jgi:hypothetical protein
MALAGLVGWLFKEGMGMGMGGWGIGGLCSS